MKDNKRKEEKRLKIVESAIMVFGDKGYFQTRIDDVVAQSGIPKGTIYEYFKNKEDLYIKCAKHSFVFIMEKTMEEMEYIKDARDNIEAFLRAHARAILSLPPQYMEMFAQVWQYALWNRNEEILMTVGEMFEYIGEKISELLAEDIKSKRIRGNVDISVLTKLLLGYVDSVTLEWFYSNGKLNIETEFIKGWEMIKEGVKERRH